ncbi:hypothetical protein SHKM778_41470 [Streptomyces sp. KM77-8]|uniref:Uncharacterized protein n=1 Tax=Streptomyces haneummycinicus TaxID=3074435 RepID=A0AAT9HJR0_9ACTN
MGNRASPSASKAWEVPQGGTGGRWGYLPLERSREWGRHPQVPGCATPPPASHHTGHPNALGNTPTTPGHPQARGTTPGLPSHRAPPRGASEAPPVDPRQMGHSVLTDIPTAPGGRRGGPPSSDPHTPAHRLVRPRGRHPLRGMGRRHSNLETGPRTLAPARLGDRLRDPPRPLSLTNETVVRHCVPGELLELEAKAGPSAPPG